MTAGEMIQTRRKALGLSQAKLAASVGTNQQTIDKIEKDIIKHSRFLPKIARGLGIELAQLDPDSYGSAPTSVIPGEAFDGARDLPVHTSAEGGKGQIVVTSDPVEWVLRPAPLATVRGGYGLIIVGESMLPEFEPGDVALVNPHLPPLPDTTCVFYSEVTDGEVRAMVKRLVRIAPDAWHVRQWNPPGGDKADFKLARGEWTKSHRTVGKYSRR